MNSRHPGPRRVWMGGSELRGLTSFRRAADGCRWLPVAAGGEFQDPNFLATLPSILLKFAAHAPPEIGSKMPPEAAPRGSTLLLFNMCRFCEKLPPEAAPRGSTLLLFNICVYRKYRGDGFV